MTKARGRLAAVMAGIGLSLLLLAGCGYSQATGDGARTAASGHEPITIMSSEGVDELEALVQAQYPEVELEVVPYDGHNYSRFTCDQMVTGEMPDIYVTTLPWLSYEQEMKSNLLDLSGYAFTDRYDPNLLAQQELDGKVYLLPSYFLIYSLGYNETLFEEHGWEVPRSFEELKALAPEIEAAGVDLAVTNSDKAGFGFQYLCNLGDTLDLSSLKGVQWQRDFLAGDATAEEGFGPALDYMREWQEIGLLEGRDTLNGERAADVFEEGNTAFIVGDVDQWTQNEDGTGDVYAPLPYLSRDGSNNMYITMPSRNFGLSAELAEPGNEQKLEDALHVMEILTTVEGQDALQAPVSTAVSPLKGWTIADDSPLAPAVELLQEGQSAPLLYAGWEGILAPVGQKGLDYLNGELTPEQFLEFIDTAQAAYLREGVHSYAEVDRIYDPEEVARLVGKVYGESVGADAALISVNTLQDDGNVQNADGVNGFMVALPLVDERIVSVAPLGWNGTIRTLRLTGAQIEEAAEAGYTLEEDGHAGTFPYVLSVKGGAELQPDRTYTVVVCGADDALVEAGGGYADSGLNGLEAFETYLDGHGNPAMSEELLRWD